jgi:hypothetical protein
MFKVGEHVAVHLAENDKAINNDKEVVANQVVLAVVTLNHCKADVKQ